jgi:hypothetical protein
VTHVLSVVRRPWRAACIQSARLTVKRQATISSLPFTDRE